MYTSYFANMRKLPEDMVFIAITVSPPKWFNGKVYKNLAPTWDILKSYKETGNEEEFKQRFYNEVLNKLDINKVVEDLKQLSGVSDLSNVCLLCYEKSDSFCHRHLVSDFLSSVVDCNEYGGN